ncbi:hypothetical protein PARA125_000937 [Parachlamydia sp. AcF125]|nr:hypothetical protein [Parachlamydia sp. AcF125]
MLLTLKGKIKANSHSLKCGGQLLWLAATYFELSLADDPQIHCKAVWLASPRTKQGIRS